MDDWKRKLKKLKKELPIVKPKPKRETVKSVKHKKEVRVSGKVIRRRGYKLSS